MTSPSDIFKANPDFHGVFSSNLNWGRKMRSLRLLAGAFKWIGMKFNSGVWKFVLLLLANYSLIFNFIDFMIWKPLDRYWQWYYHAIKRDRIIPRSYLHGAFNYHLDSNCIGSTYWHNEFQSAINLRIVDKPII